MGMRSTVILLLTSWTLLAWQSASQKSCDPGWFGSSCLYKCRCRRNNCTTHGLCTNDGPCERGWFGPACQYADLAYSISTTASPQLTVTDGDDTSCLTSYNSDTVDIVLDYTYHFRWLRVRLNNPDLLYNLTVHFRRDNSLACTNRRTGRVDNYTLDIHCDLEEKVQIVTLSGAGVPHLCSVYISGGRNIALRQNTSQSSTFENASSDKSVDGNRDTSYQRKSCTHTAFVHRNPNLNVTFSRLHHITRYVLYNRINNRHRLKGFVLTSYSQSMTPVFSYTDRETTVRDVYTVNADNVSAATHLVNVVATEASKILTLCELEVYGDTACQPGHYGRECEHLCSCAGEQPCFVSTGGCPSGCADGFQGQDCKTRCDPGSYGPGCQSSCSQFCVSDNETMTHFCDNIDGACLYGCKPGYLGSNCAKDSGKLVAIIVGCIVGIILLSVFIAALVIVSRRRGSSKLDIAHKSRADRLLESPSLCGDDVSGVRKSQPGDGYELPVVTAAVAQKLRPGEAAHTDLVNDETPTDTYNEIDDSPANTYNCIQDNVTSAHDDDNEGHRYQGIITPDRIEYINVG